jgi:predicted nucleotidyltransferase
MVRFAMPMPMTELEAFRRRWRVASLALFGSVVREDFRPDSDVDVLVTFDDGAGWSLADMVRMKDELTDIFGRDVDLVEERALRNPFRRRAILREKEVLLAG